MVNTIIISDIHLGTRDSKAEELIDFLTENTCRNLILNGDITGVKLRFTVQIT